ncbi:MFS transporter [Streptomyces beijiangensis]|uniref:MFS transporter n=1 Tax=Streptomyces beijiangensis TaxID=163361 RepID=A0A939F9M6_9ACTN|nr:MFS transporter [Streptomyces beijiangensis]MBO0514960.1 MFS transporter [Streptomyces beijiangensis]
MSVLLSFVRNNYASLHGPARTLAVLHFVDSLGGGMFISGSTVYFVVVAGLPPAQVGLGLSLAGLTGFVSSVLMGMAADRVGPRRLLFVTLLAIAGAYCLYPAVGSLPAFFPVVGLIGALEWGSGPLFHTLIMELVPEDDRVSARAALRSLFNVGFSVGALAAAALIGAGGSAMRALPLGNALSFLLAAGLVLRLPAGHVAPPKAERVSRFRALRDTSFLSVIGASSLLALHSAVLLVGIPLWLATSGKLPRSLIPVVFVLNTVLVVLLQVKCAKGSETLEGAVGAARRAGLISAAGCLALVVGSITTAWVAGVFALTAVLLFTFAELWQSSSVFGLGFGLAPESAKGEYLGAFHLHVVVQATVGPALVSFLVIHHGSFGWLAMCLVFLAGTAAVRPAVRWTAGRNRLTAAPVPMVRHG